MEGPEYVDIFATKGIEYLLVIGFLLTLVYFWRLLNRPARLPVRPGVPGNLASSLIGWFYLADDLYYHQGHSWVRPENDDVVRVGIDDFAQKLLGRPGSVCLPPVGSRVVQGEKGWKLQVDTEPIDVLSPVHGEVVAVNEDVLHSPELINQDPYEKGWLLKVRVSKLETNLKNLLSGRLARAWMEETVNTLRERYAGDLGIVLQDGGVPVVGIARNLSADKWPEIAMEFLLTR